MVMVITVMVLMAMMVMMTMIMALMAKVLMGIVKELGKLIVVKESTQGENAVSFIKEELGIDSKLAYELKEMIGTDIQLVKNELDKIKNYFNTRKFDLVEAKKIISIKEEYSIFEVIDKVIKGNKENKKG